MKIILNSHFAGSTLYHDVAWQNGLRIGDDGIIWFDGLTDDLAGFDNIYDGSLTNYTSGAAPSLKKIKLNCAIPHDTRVFGSVDIFRDGSDPNNIRDQIDESLNGVNGPALQHYVLSPHGFQQEQQVNSSPVLNGSFQTSDGGAPPKIVTVTTPITAVIYDDTSQIAVHAQRQQKDVARFKRTNTWKLPGIRLDFQVGDFIHAIVFQNAAGEYKIDAALEHVVYDFRKQETILQPE